MPEMTYENQGAVSYLVYTIRPEDTVDSMSLGMLINNKIPGFAPAIFTQMDSEKYVKFNVTARVPVSQFFAGTINKKRLLGVFGGIVKAMLSAEEYMIDPNTVLLDLDYIFADVTSCDTVLICLPIEGGERKQLAPFFKNIMFTAQFDQTENCDHVAKIMNFLNNIAAFSLDGFQRLLESVAAQSENASIERRKPLPEIKPVQPQPEQGKGASRKAEASQKPTQKPPSVSKPVQTPESRSTPAAPIPPTPSMPVQSAAPKSEPVGTEKKMTMFGVLRNFSKENLELYKAQKNAEKAPKPAAPQTPGNGKKKGNDIPYPGFTIPGQAEPTPSVYVPAKPKAPAAPEVVHPHPAPAPYTPPASYAPPAPAAPPVQIQPQTIPVQKAPTASGKASFGETMLLVEDSGGTTLLVEEPASQMASLIRTKTGEKISLNKPVFRIGKEKSYVDYFVSDNSAISRSHANIITRGENYFITDTNSTNHTYVNGNMVQSGQEVPLTDGDCIRLANEEFEFRK